VVNAKKESIPRVTAEKGVLFLGNGIHRLSHGPSWEDLIIRFANALELKDRNYELDLEKPFPLLYEELTLSCKGGRKIAEDLFKKEVQKFSDDLTPNEIHKKVLDLNLNHYMTTNYDLVFEKTVLNSDSPKNQGLVGEKRYSLFRRFDLDNRYFWHIHGEVSNPASIMLGYDHYAGALQKIREYTTTSATYENFSKRSLIARLPSTIAISSWIDLFFISDVHILGLSLDPVEMHLWWILAYRARMIADGKTIQGKVWYYLPKQKGIRLNRIEERKSELLTAFGVNVERVEMRPKDWIDYYSRAVEKIRDNGII